MRVVMCAAVAAVLLMLVGAAVPGGLAEVASAQSAPATYYGKGAPLQPGDRIEVSVGGKACASTTVTPAVEWAVTVAAAAACGPADGAAVSITVNGQPASLVPAATWKIGGLPPDQANGYKVTLGAAAPAVPAIPAGQGALTITGVVPKTGGYGLLVVTGAGSLDQLVVATGCPRETMALFATAGGGFVTYVPGTSIAVVNEAFLALFPGGRVTAGAGFIGRCV